jgi:hypothetical protein
VWAQGRGEFVYRRPNALRSDFMQMGTEAANRRFGRAEHAMESPIQLATVAVAQRRASAAFRRGI